MKSANIAIFKSVAGRVQANRAPQLEPTKQRTSMENAKALQSHHQYANVPTQARPVQIQQRKWVWGAKSSGANLPDPCEQPHRQSSLSAPIHTHKHTSISPNLHSTCTCTAVPHIVSIQTTHHAFSYQNARDALTTYSTHRIQLSIMVLDTVNLS